MIEFFTTFSLLIGLATIIAFIFLVPTLVYYFSRKRGKWLLLSLASVLMFGTFISMAQDIIFIKYMRDNLTQPSQIQISNNTEINVEGLFQALLGIRTLKGKAGSHPTDGFEFTIMISNNEYKLRAEKDSRDEGMYWVFYDGFPIGSEIGFIDFVQDSS